MVQRGPSKGQDGGFESCMGHSEKLIMKSIVHVNQHHIKANHKNGTNLPVITVKRGGKTIYAWGVKFTGPSNLEYHECDPLSCGARVWMSTEDPIILLDQNNEEFDGISFSELRQEITI